MIEFDLFITIILSGFILISVYFILKFILETKNDYKCDDDVHCEIGLYKNNDFSHSILNTLKSIENRLSDIEYKQSFSEDAYDNLNIYYGELSELLESLHDKIDELGGF